MRRMIGWAVLGLVGAAALVGAQPAADAAKVRQQLVGAYKLVWYDTFDRNGAVTRTPYTVGQIMYDQAGRMSAQLMRADRPKLAAGQATDADRGAAYSGYISYFGRYELDVEKRTVTHYVEGDLNPGSVGAVRVRHFEFSQDGKSLFLEVREGARVVGRLQWDRYR